MSKLLVVAALGFGLAGCQSQATAAPLVIVGRAAVVDGDTLEIRGQRVRLIDVDAPESGQRCERDGKPWRCGQAAALWLSDWIGVRTVTCESRRKDRYRRLLATCRVGGEDVGGALVEAGLALAAVQYGRAYVGHERRARSRQVGLWGPTVRFVPPWDWRKGRR